MTINCDDSIPPFSHPPRRPPSASHLPVQRNAMAEPPSSHWHHETLQDVDESSWFIWLFSLSGLIMVVVAMFTWMFYLSWIQPREPPPRQLNPAELQIRQRMVSSSGTNNELFGHDNALIRESSSAARALLMQCQFLPPHVDPATAVSSLHSGDTITARVLPPSSRDNPFIVDGIVAFRHTKAAANAGKGDAGPSSARSVATRRERALLLSRLLSSSNDSSPKQQPRVVRGSLLVVAIPADDVSCDRLRHILYLLATYYNVFILVHTSDMEDLSCTMTLSQVLHQREHLINKLRKRISSSAVEGEDSSLNDAILPPHRFIVSTSTAGRIAFCRQLDSQRVQLVVDFEPSVKAELNRFGYRRVYCYSNERRAGVNCKSSVSSLARALEWDQMGKTDGDPA